MTQPIVEELDRELFDAIPRSGPSPSKQGKAVRAMEHGKLLALSHEGYSICNKNGGTSCSLAAAMRHQLKVYRPDATFVMKHLPDGRLGVACFAKEDTP